MGRIYYKVGKRVWIGVIWEQRLIVVTKVINVSLPQNAVNFLLRDGKPATLHELVLWTSA
jgi:hypothetical protein